VAPMMLAAFEPLGALMTIVGLGGLIFFHELGHFLACRLTGTRVEAFSIGFGREIFGWTRKGTRYRIGVVPLGGYVKMAAENPGERNTGAPDEFPNKPFSARLFIMSAGVLFNLILAFMLFAWAFGIGVPLPSREIGFVRPGGAAWRAGILPGDVVTRIDGREILDFMDLVTEDALGGTDPIVLTVERQGHPMEITVHPGQAEGESRLGIQQAFEVADAEVPSDSPAGRAGGRRGDTILAINGEPVRSPQDVDAILRREAGRAESTEDLEVTLHVRRRDGAEEDLKMHLPLESKRPLIGITPFEGSRVEAVAKGSVADGKILPGDELVVNGKPVADLQLLRDSREEVTTCVALREGKEVPIPLPPGTTAGDLGDAVAGKSDAKSARVTPQPLGPAARAGLEAGDTVLSIAGQGVSSFEEISKEILANGTGPLEMEIERDGQARKITVTPGRWPADPGYALVAATKMHRERNVVRAMALGWKRTTRFIEMVLLTVKGLVTQRVSAKNIGGPILLVQATYGYFDQGWGLYLQILGLISVNLAILNLLPIPVLDGGQIVLLVAEKVRGKPLPEKVVGYFQVVGVVLILGLIVLAFSNDITRLLR